MSATTVPAPAPAVRSEASAARRETLGQLIRSPTFLIGSGIVLFWVACAILGSRITPYDPLAQSGDTLFSPGQGGHALGTDQLGRDVLSRVLAGSHDVLIVAPAATALGIIGGTVLGLVTGYFGGVVDDVASHVIEAFLALPLIVIAVVALVALGTSKATLIILIGIAFTPLVARTVRAAVLAERDLDYVEAARLRGERSGYIMFAELLPNVTGPIVVEATVRLGYAIFAVAGLTFLGFGVQPPSPDWSLQIADNYSLLNATAQNGYWWTVVPPALAVASLVVGVNLIADGVTRVLER